MSDLERSRRAFRDALAEGDISEGSSDVLRGVTDIVPQVDRVLTPDVYRGGEVLLVSALVDDSGSIGMYQARVQAVIDGHNRMMAAAARKATDTKVLFHTRFFTKGILSPYRPVADAPRLSLQNYRPDVDHTPLYERSVIMLGSVIAQARELARDGARVRTFTLLLTDGANNAGSSTASDVKCLVTDMLEFAPNHFVIGMGLGERSYFEPVFRQMGVRRIFAADALASIDRAFDEIDKLVEIAASSETAFRQLTAGTEP